jgi:hypothetical protein
VTSEDHSTLFEYWIERLKQERAEYIRHLKPSPYNLLTYDQKLQQALDRIKQRRESKLDHQIAFNALLREHRATRKQRKLERSKLVLPVSTTNTLKTNQPIPFATLVASNNTAAGTDTTTNNTIVPNYLNRPIKIITTPFLTSKNSTTNDNNKNTEATGEELEDLIDYGELIPISSPQRR